MKKNVNIVITNKFDLEKASRMVVNGSYEKLVDYEELNYEQMEEDGLGITDVNIRFTDSYIVITTKGIRASIVRIDNNKGINLSKYKIKLGTQEVESLMRIESMYYEYLGCKKINARYKLLMDDYEVGTNNLFIEWE